jgi:membrane protein DedA with SNARE-associated domain
MKLGHYDMPESYIKFLIQSLTGVDVDQKLVDIVAVSVLVLVLGASVLLNIKDWRKRRKASKTS